MIEIEKQYIGKDENNNLQLVVKAKGQRYFILRHTNALGCDEITQKEFLKYIVI